MVKKLDIYVYCLRKLVHIKEILMKLNVKDVELLEKYNKIWEKVSNSIKKGFDSEPIYKEKYLKTKVKSYEGKINTNFHHDKIPLYLSIGNID